MSSRLSRAELRLVPAAAAAWLAAGLAVGADPARPPIMVVVAGWAVAVVLVGALATRRGASRRSEILLLAAVAAVAVALVITVTVVRAEGRAPAELRAAATSGTSVELVATTTSAAVEGRITAVVSEARVDDATLSVSSPVLVFGDRGGARVPIGSLVRISGSLAGADPGEDVAFLAFPRGGIERLADPAPLLAAVDGLRTRLLDACAAFPNPGGGLLPGLAIGDTSRVPPSLDAAMKASSLSHLTAVSGANCAVVVGIIWAGVAAFGGRRRTRVIASLVALTGFVLLVTPQPSVLRAAVMAAVVLLALSVGRPSRGLPVLCLAVVILLVIDPWLSRDYGFALSALATAGLLVLASPLADAFGRVMPRTAALVLAIPIAAQLACQPVLLLLSPSLPLYGIPANVLAAPAAPVATVVGLLACVVLPVLPGLGTALAAMAWLPASWIAAVADFFSGLPGAQSPWPVGVPGIALLIVVSALSLTAALAPNGRMRRLARGTVAIAAIGYLASVAGLRIADVASRPSDWQYAECDIGQGDATVIRSAGAVALVDTGPEPKALTACLDDLGIDRIDLLVLTHYDLDHVGGVDAVVGRVDRVLVGPTSDAGDDRIRSTLLAGGASVEQVARGETGALGAFDWRVLWPPPSGVEPGNAASVTLLVRPGIACGRCLSAVLLGDLGQKSQARMLGATPPGHVDVVKVAHHGSADQDARLYEAIRAPVGLIGVGADNDYGHPTEALLGILAATGTAAYRTDLDGLVLVGPGDHPGDIRVWTQR